jgi:hypothetical protein
MANQNKTEAEKLDLASLDLSMEKRAELLRLFPEVRTEGRKIDFEQLRVCPETSCGIAEFSQHEAD